MTNAELIVLSMVAEGHGHGYQIQQAIEERSIRDWMAIGFSSVYYVLNKLEEDGLIAGQLKPGERGPARKVYRLSEAGKRVLQTAVADLLSTPRDPGDGFLLGVANLHHLRPEQVRRALDAYESRLRSRVAEVNRLREEHAADPVEADAPPTRYLQTLAVFDYSLHLLLAEVEWLAEFRQAWEAAQDGTLPAMRTHDPYRDPVIRGNAPTPPPARTEQMPRPADDGPAEDEPQD